MRVALSVPAAARIWGVGDAAGRSATQPAAGRPADRVPVKVERPAAAFRPWADQLGPAQLATLRASGWPVPGPMPGGLTLFDARQSATAAGRVVDFAYSDGLSVVSVFVQRGRLPTALPGWHQSDVNGKRLYVSNPGEPDLTWSARGFVYTVVAGAPAPTIAAVLNALPHEAGLGFWARMKRGLRRLWSWINPFR
jgi:sigma-E factor negative regulatory protein RseB